MLSNKPHIGRKVAGCWIFLSLCKCLLYFLIQPSRREAQKGSAVMKPRSLNSLSCFRFWGLCLKRKRVAPNIVSQRRDRSRVIFRTVGEVRSHDLLQLPEELKCDLNVLAAIRVHAVLQMQLYIRVKHGRKLITPPSLESRRFCWNTSPLATGELLPDTSTLQPCPRMNAQTQTPSCKLYPSHVGVCRPGCAPGIKQQKPRI